MKRTIKTLSFISFSLAILSCVLVVASLTILWAYFSFLFSGSKEIVQVGPIIPTGSIIYMLGCVSVASVLIASLKSKKTIILDIILIVFLSIVFPIINHCLSIAQATSLANVGYMEIIAFNTTGKIVEYLSSLIEISKYLCFIIFGMRITTAVICKNNKSK